MENLLLVAVVGESGTAIGKFWASEEWAELLRNMCVQIGRRGLLLNHFPLKCADKPGLP